jgi:hypothetical protein
MRTRTKRTRGTENPDAFIRLNMRRVRVAHFSFITHVERQLCIVNRGYAIVTKQVGHGWGDTAVGWVHYLTTSSTSLILSRRT